MGKEFVNQHIVPKKYLDRFASQIDGKSIIGTRYYNGSKPKLFLKATSDVGYIKNYYDVTDKDDPKYWEHFFAKEIDTLCGTEMEHIISTTTLSQNTSILNKHNKEILSKVIVAQMMRVPSSIDYVKEIYPRIERQVKNRVLSVLPAPLMDKYGDTVRNIKMDEQWQKEQFLNLSFSPENFDKYCRLVQDRIWIVFVNKFRSNMPFATSDNPVFIEGIGKKEIGLFSNGLTNPATCIFYPLSPAIAIASYSKQGIMGIAANDLDGKRILLDDLKYIMDKNLKIIEQAYQHSFIPQPLFDEIINGKS